MAMDGRYLKGNNGLHYQTRVIPEGRIREFSGEYILGVSCRAVHRSFLQNPK
jgi:hypothetical protein